MPILNGICQSSPCPVQLPPSVDDEACVREAPPPLEAGAAAEADGLEARGPFMGYGQNLASAVRICVPKRNVATDRKLSIPEHGTKTPPTRNASEAKQERLFPEGDQKLIG